MQHQPLLDRLLVLRDPPLTLHPKYGTVLPLSSIDEFRPFTGLVVAVGPGLRDNGGTLHPVGVAPGARVLFANAGGTAVEHNGAEHLLLREPDVLTVLAA